MMDPGQRSIFGAMHNSSVRVDAECYFDIAPTDRRQTRQLPLESWSREKESLEILLTSYSIMSKNEIVSSVDRKSMDIVRVGFSLRIFCLENEDKHV